MSIFYSNNEHEESNPAGDDVPVEIRCVKCGKLLAKNNRNVSNFEMKCVRCGTLNSLFEKMGEQVIITDPAGIILYTNEAVESVTGYSPAEIIGKKPSVWGGQMTQAFYTHLWNMIRDKKESVQVVVTNKKKSGALYNAKLRISPVLDTEKNIRFYIGIETVITHEQ